MLKHSRAYLFLKFTETFNLACENLGIPTNDSKDDKKTKHKKTSNESYPVPIIRPVSQNKTAENTVGTDAVADYLKDFKGVIIEWATKLKINQSQPI